jgi:hypothetical protein
VVNLDVYLVAVLAGFLVVFLLLFPAGLFAIVLSFSLSAIGHCRRALGG